MRTSRARGIHHFYIEHCVFTNKVRLQTMPQALPGQPAMFTGTFNCLYRTVEKEGIRGLYRGLLSPLIGVTPIYALYFLGFSTGKRLQLSSTDDVLR